MSRIPVRSRLLYSDTRSRCPKELRQVDRFSFPRGVRGREQWPGRARHRIPVPDPDARDPGGARAAATSSPRARRAPARRSRSRSRSSSGSNTDDRPAALVLVPTRELCAQVTEEFGLIAGDRVKVASVYGGVPLKAQANEAKNAHVIVATPGRLQDLVDRGLVSLDAGQGARARRGRPHARHGLQAAGRPDRAQAARRPPDDVLLGDARRRGRRARPPLHALPGPLRGRAAGRPPQRRRRPSLRRRSRPRTRSRRSSSC